MPVVQSFKALSFPSGNDVGYVAASNGVILKTTDGGVWVEDKTMADCRLEVADCRLKLTPNPSRGMLRMRIADYEMRNGNSRVSIHDVAGRLVRTLSLCLRLGAWAELDLRGLPEGVYFVSVQYGRRLLAARVVLVE